MLKITKTILPTLSILNTSTQKYDYVDSFEGDFQDIENKITPETVARAFFSTAPTWVQSLFALRNKLVALIGLKTADDALDRQTLLDNCKFEKGDRLGLFQIFDKNENEIIIGEDDKHLDFRVSLFIKKETESTKVLTISTTVVFHNWLGRLYFLPVKPFHGLIVPVMLRGVLKNLG
jgi:Protein of unknown function (DUF2867)